MGYTVLEPETPEAASTRFNKPAISLPNGQKATVRSIGVGDDRGEWVIPTVVGGKIVSNNEAIRLWKSGSNQPIGGPFKTVIEADNYAQRFHEAEATRLSKQPKLPGFTVLEPEGQIQDLNPTEDPTQVWPGSLGRTLASQVQRGKGWLQQPIVRLPRVNLEDPRVNVTPGAAGFFNKAAED